MKHYLPRTLLLILLATSGSGHAVTLGKAQVNSFLGQPLEVEIDLIGVAPGQHEDLRLRIANDVHFERLGIAYSQSLTTLKFDIAQSGTRWMVRARSTRPITEPFIEFPLQMTWPGGQLIKQYTLLLDPPHRIQPARVAQTSRAASRPAQVRSPIDGGSSSYAVQRGDSLLAIAQKLHPEGVTTRQMAMALLRANPQAFINGDMNRLRAGVVLTIPQQTVVEKLDAVSASAQYAAETRRWQAPVATSPRAQDATVTEPQIPQPAPAPETEAAAVEPPATEGGGAQLQIVSEAEGTSAPRDNKQIVREQLLMALEEVESNRIMTDAIETSLARLESELEQMKKLLELKDEQIAALQAEAEAEAREAEAAAQPQQPPSIQAVAPPPPEPALAASEPVTAAIDPAPAAVASIEAPAVARAPTPAQPWYEQYLWVVWVALGLMGLTAVLMLIRRPQAVAQDGRMADLPAVGAATGTVYPSPDEPPTEGLRQAAEDFRKLAAERLPETAAPLEPEAELPELEMPSATATDASGHTEMPGSLLDEALDEGKTLTARPEPAAPATDSEFSDEDIASWVAELGPEYEQVEADSANDEQITLTEDIPHLLIELDDQLDSQISPAEISQPERIDLESADEITEDDAFSMSLDLARAYLEIGDQDGARDMLKQALSGARDPGHRRQIEELLQQIG